MFINIIFTCIILCGYVESLNYDQRQNGDYNVQVDVKDVAIIAILGGGKEEYVDYDYAYDYSQLTIKPQNRTTPKPLSSSSGASESDDLTDATTIITTTQYFEHSINNTLDIVNSTELDDNGVLSTTEANLTSTIKSITDNVTEAPNQLTDINKRNTTVANTHSEHPNCKRGSMQNNKECQPKLNTTENALIKLVKLSQKLKLRRENKSQNN